MERPRTTLIRAVRASADAHYAVLAISANEVRVLGREVLVCLAHRRCAVTYGRSNPLDRTIAGVSDGEHAGYRRLKGERSAIERPPRQTRAIAHDVAPGQDVTAFELNRVGHPLRVRLTADQ